jgi:hypothetical protein
MSAPRTPEEWKDWRRTVREPWVAKAEEVDLLTAFGLAGSGVALKRAGQEHVGPCPECGGRRDKFAIHPSRGKWHCRGLGSGGQSAVGMVMHITGLPFLEAVELLAGEPDPARRDAPPVPAEEKARRERERAERQAANAAAAAEQERQENAWRAREQDFARETFKAAVPWPGTPVEAYLRHRRLIDDAVMPALRGLRLRFLALDYLVPEKDETGRLTFIKCGHFPVMVRRSRPRRRPRRRPPDLSRPGFPHRWHAGDHEGQGRAGPSGDRRAAAGEEDARLVQGVLHPSLRPAGAGRADPRRGHRDDDQLRREPRPHGPPDAGHGGLGRRLARQSRRAA